MSVTIAELAVTVNQHDEILKGSAANPGNGLENRMDKQEMWKTSVEGQFKGAMFFVKCSVGFTALISTFCEIYRAIHH